MAQRFIPERPERRRAPRRPAKKMPNTHLKILRFNSDQSICSRVCVRFFLFSFEDLMQSISDSLTMCRLESRLESIVESVPKVQSQ